MILNDVKTVNMSLAGPPNRIVEAAIRRAATQGIVIVAAAGNNGPTSPPRFPAAYANVIAVTAVTRQHRAYPRAVRGPHIDFAGPGVEILAASNEGGYSNVSGTSIAAPFVTAAVVLRCAGASLCEDHDRLVELLAAFAIDLGLPGHDPIYGNGLIHP